MPRIPITVNSPGKKKGGGVSLSSQESRVKTLSNPSHLHSGNPEQRTPPRLSTKATFSFFLLNISTLEVYIYPDSAITGIYDHRLRRTGHPVRSAIHKPQIGRLVVGWVTTSEYLLLYVFCSFWRFLFLFLAPPPPQYHNINQLSKLLHKNPYHILLRVA
jgi:hypothetical protein